MEQRIARMPPPDKIGPTRIQTRILSIDAVRGFALFGVLLVNMFNFGAYSPEWSNVHVVRLWFCAAIGQSPVAG